MTIKEFGSKGAIQQQQALFAWLEQSITVLQKPLKFNY